MGFFSDRYPPILLWAFLLSLLIFLVVDLGFINKKAKVVSTESAAWQSLFWVSISVAYGILIYFNVDDEFAGDTTLLYFSAYVTEKSLSVDNIFVILLILKFFQIEEKYFHRILFWGVLGAIVFRAIFIFTGTWVVHNFEWILYIFGLFLLYSGFKIYMQTGETQIDPDKSPVTKFVKKYFPVTTKQVGGDFIHIENGKRYITPLLIALISIEVTDLIFAVDSIPAAFAITQDSFIIYTSNIFAVMGLRAMFFLLSSVLRKFHLLEKGLAIVLAFIGIKMLIELIHIHIPIYTSFIIIMGVLFGSIFLSLIFKKKTKKAKVGF